MFHLHNGYNSHIIHSTQLTGGNLATFNFEIKNPQRQTGHQKPFQNLLGYQEHISPRNIWFALGT
jgi:hypothetical protein